MLNKTELCPKCNALLIQISVMHNIRFFSCNNDDCENNAEVLLNVGTDVAPSYIRMDEMVSALNNIDVSNKEEVLLLDE